MDRTLIFGYGNPDRQDDGIAWHVLSALNRRLGRPSPKNVDEDFPDGGLHPDLKFELQLTPELAELLADYQRVCFVDAHTGYIPAEVRMIEVTPEFQKSPFTHHMTPSTCLAMSKTLFNGCPQAVLVSVRGYEFGFTQSLSKPAQALVDQAADRINMWLNEVD